MKQFFSNLGQKMRQSMIGRNGNDEISRAALFVSIACLICSFFFWHVGLLIAAVVLLVYSYFRILSKNLQARRRENMAYVGFTNKVRNWFKGIGNSFAQRKKYGKDFHFYRCPQCGHELRVPKGKGKIRITCPNCGNKFEKRA